MDGLWDGTKYLWELVVAVLSGAFSYMMYRHKKNKEQLETISDSIDNHESILQVFEERFKHLMKDVEEIKKDLKKILFKL